MSTSSPYFFIRHQLLLFTKNNFKPINISNKSYSQMQRSNLIKKNTCEIFSRIPTIFSKHFPIILRSNLGSAINHSTSSITKTKSFKFATILKKFPTVFKLSPEFRRLIELAKPENKRITGMIFMYIFSLFYILKKNLE